MWEWAYGSLTPLDTNLTPNFIQIYRSVNCYVKGVI